MFAIQKFKVVLFDVKLHSLIVTDRLLEIFRYKLCLFRSFKQSSVLIQSGNRSADRPLTAHRKKSTHIMDSFADSNYTLPIARDSGASESVFQDQGIHLSKSGHYVRFKVVMTKSVDIEAGLSFMGF